MIYNPQTIIKVRPPETTWIQINQVFWLYYYHPPGTYRLINTVLPECNSSWEGHDRWFNQPMGTLVTHLMVDVWDRTDYFINVNHLRSPWSAAGAQGVRGHLLQMWNCHAK